MHIKFCPGCKKPNHLPWQTSCRVIGMDSNCPVTGEGRPPPYQVSRMGKAETWIAKRCDTDFMRPTGQSCIQPASGMLQCIAKTTAEILRSLVRSDSDDTASRQGKVLFFGYLKSCVVSCRYIPVPVSNEVLLFPDHVFTHSLPFVINGSGRCILCHM